MADTTRVFDRRQVRLHRDRAAATLGQSDFLLREVGERLVERLLDVNRRFAVALDLGCHTGEFARALADRRMIDHIVHCDPSFEMVCRADGRGTVADEDMLPYRHETFDLIVSNLSLHWVNDLPGALLQARQALRPDGLFVAALLGGDTLKELRDCLMAAELDLAGGASPRVSPFAELRDLGGLLQRAGFALPVADRDHIDVTYASPFELMADLRAMGETNAVVERRRAFTPRSLIMRAAELYQARHADPDGRVTAGFDIIFLHGWAPHDSQQQPEKPGSARARLATALQTEEIPAGEKAQPAGKGAEDP